ncbi:hypothetical protein LTR64_002424 [Lithohypha guttulata]|uniref:uncharacterized protein n=1 Tax=Lithohypha guttulata TaxID=1690604 RepID=UPI00315D3677
MDITNSYPLPDRASLSSAYVGKTLKDVPLPSAVLDLAKLKKNCALMLDTVKTLDVDFRAHVKTHKTAELARYQVGGECKDVRLIGSTVAELENLIPLMKDYQKAGARVNVLYGIPAGPSHAARLAGLLQSVGPGSLSLMIDNPRQLDTATRVYELAGSLQVRVFLKTDSGYHRAGLAPTSDRMQDLVRETLSFEAQGIVLLEGLYSHNSLSYGGNSPLDAMDNLRTEVDACSQAALANTPNGYISSRDRPLSISCGASPTALSLQNLLSNGSGTAATKSADTLRASLAKAREAGIHFEIHAGVYPTFDMQQVAASSRELGERPEDNIALTVLTEICSTYPDRTETPEALVSVGTIALAREPCKSYRGHGVVAPWNMSAEYDPYSTQKRIIVDRVSQEHGLLQWEDRGRKEALPVEYGQRVRIWPNHACITSSQYGWYLIVDSESEDKNVIRDVWVRWRGW